MSLVAFRTLEDLGYSEAQVKAFAANYEVTDGPNADGEMFTRTAVASDHFPAPFPNQEAAAAANNGAAPPDFSLIAKARGVTRGFPTFVFDIFTQYQQGGPDYIHALLTGYQDPPEGVEVAEGTYFNSSSAQLAENSRCGIIIGTMDSTVNNGLAGMSVRVFMVVSLARRTVDQQAEWVLRSPVPAWSHWRDCPTGTDRETCH